MNPYLPWQPYSPTAAYNPWAYAPQSQQTSKPPPPPGEPPPSTTVTSSATNTSADAASKTAAEIPPPPTGGPPTSQPNTTPVNSQTSTQPPPPPPGVSPPASLTNTAASAAQRAPAQPYQPSMYQNQQQSPQWPATAPGMHNPYFGFPPAPPSYGSFPPAPPFGGFNPAAMPPTPASQPWWHQPSTQPAAPPPTEPKRSVFRFRIGVQGVQNQQPRKAPSNAYPPPPAYPNSNPASQYANSNAGATHYQPPTPATSTNSYTNPNVQPVKRRKLNTFSPAPPPEPAPTPAPAPAPAAAKPAASGASAFPPALQNFVVRAYQACVNDKDKRAVEGKLRQLITSAIQKKTMHLTDWANHPLPTLPSTLSSQRKRARRKEKQRWSQSNHDTAKTSSSAMDEADRKEDLQRRRRQMRFHSASQASSRYTYTHSSPRAPSLEPIVGTCTNLEKRYLRLTGLPDPAKIRPLRVLKRSLAQLCRKWAAKECDYLYACEQFKSIRQDLTVQHLFGKFSVEVYEAHAHVALTSKDMNEFNQCQTRLIDLYMQDWGEEEVPGHPMEFLAYRILYFIFINSNTDISKCLANLTSEQRSNAAVRHALAVRGAIASNNYFRFFQLYRDVPNKGIYLMNHFVDAMRMRALQLLCKAYLPHFPASELQSILAFDDLKQCTEWVTKAGGVVKEKTVKVSGKAQLMQVIDTRPSYRVISTKKTGWGSGLL